MKITQDIMDNGRRIVHATYTKDDLIEIRNRVTEWLRVHGKLDEGETTDDAD